MTDSNNPPKYNRARQPKNKTDILESLAQNWEPVWVGIVDEIKTEVYHLQHIQTGADLIYFSNEDDNKVFSISFRTPPADNTGIAHILEHSVLCGSEKFPTKEPFIELLKGSLQTFLNAFTSEDRTVYPVASRNNKDFLNLINVYLDAVFFPNAIKIPEILMQEGWHYELDENNNLNYNGIVYNEMKGVYSAPQNILYQTIQKALYPDSTYKFDAGGDPNEIININHESFVNFHKKYYHPSNSLIYFYGNGNIKEHLNYIHNEYLSKFKKQIIDTQIQEQPPLTTPVDVTEYYSVDPTESTDAKTFLSLNYLVRSAINNPVRACALELLTYLLVGSEGGPLKRALLDAGIGLDVSCTIDNSIKQPYLSLIVHNADPEKKQLFIDTVNKSLQRLIRDGFSGELTNGAINRTEFSLREFQVPGFPKGLALNMNMLESWTYGGDPIPPLKFEHVLYVLRIQERCIYFEQLVEEIFLKNNSYAFVMLQPKQGLAKENNDKLTAKLADIKANLSDEELNKIKLQQEALIKRQVTPDNPEDIAKIPRLALSDIDKQAEYIPFDETDDWLNVNVETNGIAYISVFFNALQDVGEVCADDFERAAYVALLSDILTRVDTAKYKFADLNSKIDLHTGGITANLSAYTWKGKASIDDYTSWIVMKTKVMPAKLEKGLELLNEIIDNSKFTDLARIKEIIQELRVSIEQSLLSSGQRYAQTRSASYFSAYNLYKEKIGGIDYYRFLVDLERRFDKEGEKIAAKLDEISSIIMRKSRGNLYLTLSQKELDESKHVFEQFRKEFADKKTTTKPIQFTEQQLNEAVIIPSQVQYVVKSADYAKTGFTYSGKMLVLANILRTGYLWNNVRVQGGAYGGGFAADRNNVFCLWSYRDPHLRRTIDVYDGVADYLENLELSEDDLTNAIIATIGSLDKPLTPAEKGGRVVAMKLSGLTHEDIQKERDEVLSTTVNDLREFAPMFKNGMKQNNICVFGNEQKLQEEISLFKNTLRPID
ncbi:MAG: insulinase family protein [Planctomycetaceae bacterium]|jgi:Zn-dependent M16 (insulinase) family peptidase|nr:insulinase family protein [Planctomycetaceae bacterium]